MQQDPLETEMPAVGTLTEETNRLIASNKVEGTAVYNRQGERLARSTISWSTSAPAGLSGIRRCNRSRYRSPSLAHFHSAASTCAAGEPSPPLPCLAALNANFAREERARTGPRSSGDVRSRALPQDRVRPGQRLG